jgi:colicin import membrane protein
MSQTTTQNSTSKQAEEEKNKQAEQEKLKQAEEEKKKQAEQVKSKEAEEEKSKQTEQVKLKQAAEEKQSGTKISNLKELALKLIEKLAYGAVKSVKVSIKAVGESLETLCSEKKGKTKKEAAQELLVASKLTKLGPGEKNKHTAKKDLEAFLQRIIGKEKKRDETLKLKGQSNKESGRSRKQSL